MNRMILLLNLSCVLFLVSCFARDGDVLRHWPVDDASDLAPASTAVFDAQTSWDDGGSLRIDAPQSTTVPLYETGDLDIESSFLVFEASMSCRDLSGEAYLEMWCVFPDGSRYFSRGLNDALIDSRGWTTHQTLFRLEEGQNPVNVLLNLVIQGSGTVWIDDIKLKRVPL